MKSKRVKLLNSGIWLISFLVTSIPVLAVDDPFGTINNPVGQGSLGPQGGLITLLNNILRLIFIGSGIFAFLKILIAGVGFINAGGDSKKVEQAWGSIWQSLLGLGIILSSIAIAALIGILFFGSASAILNPQIYGPSGNTGPVNTGQGRLAPIP